MKTVEVNNDTIGEFKHSESYFVLVFSILYFVVVIIVYPLWIIAMTVNIKKRVRKLRQLKANILVSREEEERQKWNLYNEETYLVKESYLLAICICEFSLVILALSVQMYVLLKRDLEEFHNTAVPPEYKCITNSVRIVLYEEPIVMLLEGSILIFLHTVILLVCSLIRYLIDRYLLRKTYNRLTIIVYGILSCVFIMIFFNKYTYYFRIFPSFVFVVDLFLLLRYRKSPCIFILVTVIILIRIIILSWKLLYQYCTILHSLFPSLVKSSFLLHVLFIHSISSSVTVLQDSRNNQIFTMRRSNLLLIDIIRIL